MREVARRAPREHYPAPYAIIDLWARYGAHGPQAFEAEARSIAHLFTTQSSRNLVRVFLLQDRLKSAGGKSAAEIRHVHVVGAGVMGGDIAAWSALRGFTVTLQDRALEYVQPGGGRARGVFDNRRRGPARGAAARARLTADVAGEGLADADVVIEAIFESLEAKQELSAQLEPRLKPGALLATNPSSLMLEPLGATLARPQRLVGLHFFNPVAQMPLIEIVHAQHTDPAALHAATGFARRLDKLPLPCRSAPGFMVNRVLTPYMHEAMLAAQEGVPLTLIDAAAVSFGMPVGPIELTDIVGLDVAAHVGEIIARGLGRPASAAPRLSELLAAKRLGRKSGAGFYVWRDRRPGQALAAAPRKGPHKGLCYHPTGTAARALRRATRAAQRRGVVPVRLHARQAWAEMAEEQVASVQSLKNFAPLDAMKRENLAALAKKVSVRTLSAGRVLFSQGDTDKRTLWLVSGSVDVNENERNIAVLRSGTPEARNPLYPKLPRRVTVRAVEDISYLAIESDLLDVMITWDQTGTYEVEELQAQLQSAGSDDWMTTLLQTNAFHRIPPANIQAIFQRLQRVPCRAGEVVIKQGDEGDYFYIIVNGKCAVTRETPLSREGIKLAELGVGDSFGEEALIAEAKRNATITMTTEGVLRRLNKQDFRELMNAPLLQWVSPAEAHAIIARGGRWLDVRLPSEHQTLTIEGALNVPLYLIRLKLSMLDRKTPYVVYCDTGRRSSAAAYILVERGFDAYVLTGGASSSEGLQLVRGGSADKP